MTTSELHIAIEGAGPEDIRRGLAAAHKVFDDASVTPWFVAKALHKREGEDISGVDAWRHKISEIRRDGADATAIATERADLASYIQERGIEEMSEADHRACPLWDEAEQVAIEACCAGWATKPEQANLSLVYPDDDDDEPAPDPD